MTESPIKDLPLPERTKFLLKLAVVLGIWLVVPVSVLVGHVIHTFVWGTECGRLWFLLDGIGGFTIIFISFCCGYSIYKTYTFADKVIENFFGGGQ